MKSFCTAIVVIGLVLAAGGNAAARNAARNSGAQDEQEGLRCRRLQRAVQMVVGSEGYESPRLRRPTATVRKPRRVIRDVLGYSVERRSVGRSCFQCISSQIRHRVPLVEQEACGFHDTCIDDGTCPPCSHDVCEAGAAIAGSCNTCAADVCAVDPFCCDTLWSEDCVAKVETICGDSCSAPPPSTSTTTLESATSTTLLETTTTAASPTTTSTLTQSTTTTTLVADPEGPNGCVDVIDFDDEHTGKILAQAMTTRGRPVVVKGTNSRFSAATNAAVIYDSECSSGRCSGQDPDLGTPNEDFDGPGEGEGGRRGGPGENSSPRGNVLIIGENLTDSDADGFVDNPDDQGTATVIHELDFSAFAPTVVRGLTLLDVENVEQPASIELFDMDGASLAKFPVPATGNNGVAVIDLPATSGVWKMIVTLRGSSAIDQIRLGCGEGGGSTTTTTTTSTTLPTSSDNLACEITFSVDNATTALALQFEVDHSSRPGGFSKSTCTVVPTGLVDVNADGATVEIGWADSTGSGFTGPGNFATCTFISTSGTPVLGDFPIEVLDCSGAPPPDPCNPAPVVGVTLGDCNAVAAVCGNEVVEAGESCDDGNVLAGDGCSSLCALEGTTTTTTVPITTTTMDDTPTTTLPDTTTTTVEATTTTSTTSTTIAESFEFLCTLRTAVTTSETLGSLKYEIDYSGVTGDFAGSGLGVECTSLVAGASKSFFEDATNRKLRESVISLSGFAGPLDLATCNFQTNDNGLVAADFPLVVKDATTPGLEFVTPTVIVKSVECTAAVLGFGLDFSPRVPEAAPNGAVF